MGNYLIKDIDTAIANFRGDYLFLSNFYNGNTFIYRGCRFNNAEAPFHAEKCISRIKDFEMLSPLDAKRLGRKVTLRKDWEEVKDKIMYNVCYAKFTKDEDLKKKLISTGDRELIEGNSHNDRCWGMTFNNKTNSWIGENRLGIVLMKLRQDLKK